MPLKDALFDEIQARLKELENPEDAAALLRFFKTGKGEYGEGDRFRGIRTPQFKALAKEFRAAPLETLELLLQAELHEDRALALAILVLQFEKGSPQERERIFKLYLKSAPRINNWDLVDCSAPQIVGGHLLDKDRAILYELAASKLLWERRIAIVSTLQLIRAGQFDDCLRLCEKLLGDKHDLMRKACGWMLREAGKRDLVALEGFLKKNAPKMPRTMLRYAIEKFPEPQRRAYLAVKRLKD